MRDYLSRTHIARTRASTLPLSALALRTRILLLSREYNLASVCMTRDPFTCELNFVSQTQVSKLKFRKI
jgi:hypothetical protein